MPQGPAARITDPVVHPLPPVLTPGPGSLNTLIGFLPAWRAIPTAAAAGIQAAKQAADIAIQTAEAATKAAAGTPGAPAALLAEQTLKASTLAAMTSTIASASMGADIHACVTPSPVPPHGPGVVIDGSPTVLINNLPASRMGDTIIEPLGPPNKIAMGCPTVIIGQSGSGCSISGGGGSSAGGAATVGGSGGSAIPASSDAAGKSTLSGPTPPVSGAGSASSTPASGGGGSPGGGSPAAKALTSAAASATGVIDCALG